MLPSERPMGITYTRRISVLKDKGIDNTAENIANELMSLNIMHGRSRGTEFFRGSDIAIEEFLTYADALGIDTDHLYH